MHLIDHNIIKEIVFSFIHACFPQISIDAFGTLSICPQYSPILCRWTESCSKRAALMLCPSSRGGWMCPELCPVGAAKEGGRWRMRTFLFPQRDESEAWGFLHWLSGDWVLVSNSYNQIFHLPCFDWLPFPIFLPLPPPPPLFLESPQTNSLHSRLCPRICVW